MGVGGLSATLGVTVQHSMSAGPGQYPGVEVCPERAEHAATSRHSPGAPSTEHDAPVPASGLAPPAPPAPPALDMLAPPAPPVPAAPPAPPEPALAELPELVVEDACEE